MILAALTRDPTATPEPSLIKDIVPPVPVFPYPAWMVVTAGLAGLLLLAALVAAIRLWLKSRPRPPPPTPRTIALRVLERLRGKVQTLEPYQFSIAVSAVLRTYVGAEYGLHAPRQTSPEFLASIAAARKFTDADRQLLAQFLERCDLIKFARIDATAEDGGRLLESAFGFVQGGRA
jgi:hypothetical protein